MNSDLSRRRRTRLMLLPLAALAVGLVACGSDDDSSDTTAAPVDTGGETSQAPDNDPLADAKANGITIGIANERPYGYEEDGEATGEAPELAKAVLSELGVEQVDFQVVEFSGLIGGLNAERFDMIAAGMFINPERAEQVLFTDPDYCGTTGFGVPEGNPDGLSDFQSIIDTGVTLGVLSGAVEEGYALDSGVPESQISAFPSTPDLFDALDVGRVDAAVLTAITVREQVADLDGFEATEGFVPVIDGVEQLGCGAFAFRYDDAAIRDAFNDVLVEMRENDEILPIIEPFGFTSAETDAAKGVTVEDLANPAGTDEGSETTEASTDTTVATSEAGETTEATDAG